MGVVGGGGGGGRGLELLTLPTAITLDRRANEFMKGRKGEVSLLYHPVAYEVYDSTTECVTVTRHSI